MPAILSKRSSSVETPADGAQSASVRQRGISAGSPDGASSLEKFGVGQPVSRGGPYPRPWPRVYSDDYNLPGQAYAAFARSGHAHGVIRSIETADALAMPGVLAIHTGADL